MVCMNALPLAIYNFNRIYNCEMSHTTVHIHIHIIDQSHDGKNRPLFLPLYFMHQL